MQLGLLAPDKVAYIHCIDAETETPVYKQQPSGPFCVSHFE